MAGGVVGNLRVNLGLDSGQFQAGLDQAQSSAGKFSKVLKTTFVAAAAAAAAALGAIALGVRNTLTEVDDLSKMASKIGIPIEELSKLKYAADMSGVSMQGLQTSVSRLSRNMADAANGTGAGAKAFKQLGISVKDADGKLKSSTSIMAEIADKFEKMPDGAKKTALAMELMGKSGADMIPMLNGGSAALNELLLEAKALGLEISAKTGRAAEEFNDNVSRMGYAVSGLTIGITAALAPALVVITEAMVQFTKWVLGAVEYLPTLAEYAAVAGGALAVMFSPAIVAAIANMTVAIGVGLVGAVRLLTAAIAANPLGALAIGITIAITAIYHFRDEIQKAIGVDVVAIVKSAINTVIGVFVGGFDAVAATWAQLPAAMGDLAYRAGYLLADNIRYWINEAILLVDGFIGTLNEKVGTGIARLKTLAPLKPDNPYKGAAAGVADAAKNAMTAALSRDWIDELGSAFFGATPGANDFATALGGVGDELDDIGGGKGKDSKGKKAKDAIDKIGKAMESAKESLGQGFGSIIDGLVNGTLSWKDAILQAGQALLKYLNSMNLAQGGQGLFGGGFLQGLIGSLIGFANGTNYAPGGLAVVGERGPEIVNLPRGSQVIPNHQLRSGGRSTYAPVYNIDARGADAAAIARLEAGLRDRDRKFGSMVDHRVNTRQTRGTRA